MSVPESDTPSVLEGPLETGTFPERITARVVSPGARPRIHGYDVEADLARHYQPADVLFLSLVGELPTPAVSQALAATLVFLAPVSVAHASAHAALLARLCGATTSASVGVAAIGLAEQARALVAEHASLLAWLDDQVLGFPARFRSTQPEDVQAVERLRAALSGCNIHVPGLDQSPTRAAAPLLVLHALGLRRSEQIEAAVVSARFPATVAEALATKVVDFQNYPINLPRYVYEGS